MRPSSRKKPSPAQQRQEQWRKDRASAQTLRNAYPTAERVNVHLQFQQPTAQRPTAQSFELYPPARAFFEYPCPYGDCDGIFDLGAAIREALGRASTRVEGTLECCGVRPGDGGLKLPCGLRVNYTLAAQYKAEPATRT